MTPFKSAAPLNQSYSISIGNQYDLLGKQIGLIGSLSYKNEHSGYVNGQVNRWDRGVADANKTQLDTNLQCPIPKVFLKLFWVDFLKHQ